MKIRHIRNDYFCFTFYDGDENKSFRELVHNYLMEQTELFYIVEETGILVMRQVIVRVLDPKTITWLKLMSNL